VRMSFAADGADRTSAAYCSAGLRRLSHAGCWTACAGLDGSAVFCPYARELDHNWFLVGNLLASVAYLDAAVRKLLLQLQTSPQRFHENSVFCFRYSVHFDNVAFVRKVSGEVVPHKGPTVVRPDSRPIQTTKLRSVSTV
jgi:hypothetical protein